MISFQRKTADDVVVADPQALALAKPPQGERLLVLVVQRPESAFQRSSISDDRSGRSGPARSQSSSSGSRIKTSLK